MRRPILAIVTASLASCANQAPQEITDTDSQALSNPGCGDPIATTEWNPADGSVQAWPAGASRVNLISTPGDDDGTGRPTVYFWIVRGGNYVDRVLRVAKSQWLVAQSSLIASFSAFEVAHPGAALIYSSGATNGQGLPHPPGHQPGGIPGVVFNETFVHRILQSAGEAVDQQNLVLAATTDPSYALPPSGGTTSVNGVAGTLGD